METRSYLGTRKAVLSKRVGLVFGVCDSVAGRMYSARLFYGSLRVLRDRVYFGKMTICTFFCRIIP